MPLRDASLGGSFSMCYKPLTQLKLYNTVLGKNGPRTFARLNAAGGCTRHAQASLEAGRQTEATLELQALPRRSAHPDWLLAPSYQLSLLHVFKTASID